MPELGLIRSISGDLRCAPDPSIPPVDDLFRARLSTQLDARHPLVQLAGVIDWRRFEAAFGPLYHETAGRPGKPVRLMVGLTYLKHTYDLSGRGGL
jgi:IS5 family transposase